MNEELELAEIAWGIIANVSEGNWKKQPLEWQEAAARWRDRYHEILRKNQAAR